MSNIPQLIFHDITIRKSLDIVGYSSLVYNHILTFDKEIEFVWRGPRTVTKVAFLLSRYGNLLGQTYMQIMDSGWIVHGPESLKLCQGFNLFSTVFMFFSAESIHIIVLMRAWAIWGCRKRVAAVLIISYILYLLFTIVMTCLGAKTPIFNEFQYLGLVGICVGVVPPFIWSLPLASLILDTLVFGTTMRSLWKHSRESRHLYPSPLLHLLIRDAVLFYMVSAFYNAFVILCWTTYLSSPIYVASITFSLNLLCITGQRIVLNLRGLTTRTYGSRSLSAEVDRQIARLHDARPDWWSTSGQFHSGDDMLYEYASGSLGKGVKANGISESRGLVNVEMATSHRLPEGYSYVSQEGPTTRMEEGLWTSRRTGELDAVSEVVRPPEDIYVPAWRAHT